jgi:type IV secretory pathway VirB10-like protein
MLTASYLNRLFAVALFAIGTSVCVAESGAASDAAKTPAKPQPAAKVDAKPQTPAAPQPTPKVEPKPQAPAPADVQALVDQFKTQRDQALASRQALLDQLNKATDKERATILKQLESQQKDFLDAQRALYKQLRDDMRKQRASLPPGGGGRH